MCSSEHCLPTYGISNYVCIHLLKGRGRKHILQVYASYIFLNELCFNAEAFQKASTFKWLPSLLRSCLLFVDQLCADNTRSFAYSLKLNMPISPHNFSSILYKIASALMFHNLAHLHAVASLQFIYTHSTVEGPTR